MPLLNQEPPLFPPELFDETIDQALLHDKVWWVLHTKPRQEKSLARELFRRQVPFYLPQVQKRWRLRGRTMSSFVPLFAGYMFLMADGKDRLAALTTNRIVNSIKVPDQSQLWGDLRQIHKLIATGAPVTPEDKLGPGDQVEIRSGALMGLRGTILATATGRRFVVKVDFIHRGASVLIDDIALAPAS
jgi:transcription antitermination factor NusG